MRNKEYKTVFFFIQQQEIVLNNFRGYKDVFKEKEGIDLVDRHFNRALTMTFKALLSLLEEVGRGMVERKIKVDIKRHTFRKMGRTVVKDEMHDTLKPVLEKVDRKMFAGGLNSRFDLSKSIKGLTPEIKELFVNLIITSVLIRDGIFNFNEEPEIEKRWNKYHDRIDTMINQLIKHDILFK